MGNAENEKCEARTDNVNLMDLNSAGQEDGRQCSPVRVQYLTGGFNTHVCYGQSSFRCWPASVTIRLWNFATVNEARRLLGLLLSIAPKVRWRIEKALQTDHYGGELGKR